MSNTGPPQREPDAQSGRKSSIFHKLQRHRLRKERLRQKQKQNDPKSEEKMTGEHKDGDNRATAETTKDKGFSSDASESRQESHSPVENKSRTELLDSYAVEKMASNAGHDEVENETTLADAETEFEKPATADELPMENDFQTHKELEDTVGEAPLTHFTSTSHKEEDLAVEDAETEFEKPGQNRPEEDEFSDIDGCGVPRGDDEHPIADAETELEKSLSYGLDENDVDQYADLKDTVGEAPLTLLTSGRDDEDEDEQHVVENAETEFQESSVDQRVDHIDDSGGSLRDPALSTDDKIGDEIAVMADAETELERPALDGDAAIQSTNTQSDLLNTSIDGARGDSIVDQPVGDDARVLELQRQLAERDAELEVARGRLAEVLDDNTKIHGKYSNLKKEYFRWFQTMKNEWVPERRANPDGNASNMPRIDMSPEANRDGSSSTTSRQTLFPSKQDCFQRQLESDLSKPGELASATVNTKMPDLQSAAPSNRRRLEPSLTEQGTPADALFAAAIQKQATEEQPAAKSQQATQEPPAVPTIRHCHDASLSAQGGLVSATANVFKQKQNFGAQRSASSEQQPAAASAAESTLPKEGDPAAATVTPSPWGAHKSSTTTPGSANSSLRPKRLLQSNDADKENNADGYRPNNVSIRQTDSLPFASRPPSSPERTSPSSDSHQNTAQDVFPQTVNKEETHNAETTKRSTEESISNMETQLDSQRIVQPQTTSASYSMRSNKSSNQSSQAHWTTQDPFVDRHIMPAPPPRLAKKSAMAVYQQPPSSQDSFANAETQLESSLPVEVDELRGARKRKDSPTAAAATQKKAILLPDKPWTNTAIARNFVKRDASSGQRQQARGTSAAGFVPPASRRNGGVSIVTTRTPRTTSFFTQSDDEEDSEPNYKYQEVVRGREARRALLGYTCDECERQWEAISRNNNMFDRKDFIACSKHRAKFIPPSTPDEFWNLSFPDE